MNRESLDDKTIRLIPELQNIHRAVDVIAANYVRRYPQLLSILRARLLKFFHLDRRLLATSKKVNGTPAKGVYEIP